uniref:transmembrane protein 182-like n=1 Tax=Myxine glutinosa TaxID=7769 RepID=UPI00358ED3DC
MKLRWLMLTSGILALLSTLLTVLALGSDYWLLSSEPCTRNETELEAAISSVSLSRSFSPRPSLASQSPCRLLSHEGLWWRCWGRGSEVEVSLATFCYSNQMTPKLCRHATLNPFPLAWNDLGESDNAFSAYCVRLAWAVLLSLSAVSALLASLILLTAATFMHGRLFLITGILYLLTALFLILTIILFISWVNLAPMLLPQVSNFHSPMLSLSQIPGPSLFIAVAAAILSLPAALGLLLSSRRCSINVPH